MSTTPNVPYHLQFSVEVPGTPKQVWQAIATAKRLGAIVHGYDVRPETWRS